MSARLQIALLGSLVVRHGDQAVPTTRWHSRHIPRLLGILISARGNRVPNEQLLAWLWPERTGEVAAVTLRSAISSLRQTLDNSNSGRASSRYILTKSGGYAWNTASDAWIDFEQFLALTDSHSNAPQTTPLRIARLERALALYQGDYLADEPDETPWVQPLRQMLRERYLNALTELAELQSTAGTHDAAIELARRGLATEPLREPLYRVLMRAQARSGDVAGALRSYEQYRHLLSEELGAEPAPQSQALHTAILRGEITNEPPPTPPTRNDARQPITNSNLAPFVGRTHELQQLRTWISDATKRHGGTVALVGEAGIGKTRLAEEARRLAEQQGMQMIWLRCTILERELPFAPLGEGLRALLHNAPEPLLRRMPEADLAQIIDLLPALRERLPNLPILPDVPPAERRNRQLNGLQGAALAISRMTPLLICCDDAQWADEATLAALGRLARVAHRHALLIVLAYRSEELSDNPALHAFLRSLGRDMLLRPLVLPRLEQHEVAHYLTQLAPSAKLQIEQLAPRLASSTGGNPLFLSVAVRSLLEAHGAPSLETLLPRLPADVPLPNLASVQHIRDLLLGQLERLDSAARDLLDRLALIGRAVSLDLIEQLDPNNGLISAQLLLERTFLAEQPDGRLQIDHDLLRSIVADAIGSPRRRLAHRQIAEALQALHGERPEHAGEIALHYGKAGQGADAAVLRFATIAGDHARQGFAYQAALGHYNAALQAAERLGSRADIDITRRAFAGRLRTYEALLDWDGMLETDRRYGQWAAHHQQKPALIAPRRLVLLRALMGDLAGAAQLSADHANQRPEAIPMLQDMLARTARILQPVSELQANEGTEPGDVPPPAAWQPVEPPPGAPASELPALLGPEEAAVALFQVGWAALVQGLIQAAEPCLHQAYTLGKQTGQAAVAVISALQLAHLHDLRGERSATHEWLATSIALAERVPEAAWASIWPRIHEAFLLLLDDRLDEAEARFTNLACQLNTLAALQSHRASVEVGLGLLALQRGDLENAHTRLQHALHSPQLIYGFVQVVAQHGLARIAALRGQPAQARRLLYHALASSAQRGLLPEYIRSAIAITRFERDFGRAAQALPLLHNAIHLAETAELGALASAARTLLQRLS